MENRDQKHIPRLQPGILFRVMRIPTLVPVILLLILGAVWTWGAVWGQADSTPRPSVHAGESSAKSADEKPSLAELARLERQRRAASTEKVQVIQNEDLRALRARARVSTGQSTGALAPASVVIEEGAEVSEEAGQQPDMGFWSGVFQEARTGLETAVNQLMVLELRINNLRNAYFQATDGVTRERIEAQIAATHGELEQARENETAARQLVRDLERQAAQAGLTPGQIRDLVGALPEAKSIADGVPQAEENPDY